MKNVRINLFLPLITTIVLLFASVPYVHAMITEHQPYEEQYSKSFGNAIFSYEEKVKSHFIEGSYSEKTMVSFAKEIFESKIGLFLPTKNLSDLELMQIISFATDIRLGILAYDNFKNQDSNQLSSISERFKSLSLLEGNPFQKDEENYSSPRVLIDHFFNAKPSIKELLQRYEDMRIIDVYDYNTSYSESTDQPYSKIKADPLVLIQIYY